MQELVQVLKYSNHSRNERSSLEVKKNSETLIS